MGQVGQDRDVVGDRPDPAERQAVRRRLDDRRPVAGVDHRPERRLERRRLRASWRAPRWRPGAPPIRVAAVPVIPVRIPAASSAATARNEVVVLPSVPVIPTTASSRLGSPYHHAAAVARADRRAIDDELGQVDVGDRPLDERRRRAPGGRLGHEVVAVDVEPGHGDEERARPDRRANRGSRRVPRCRPGRRRRSPGRRVARRAAGPRRSSRSMSPPSARRRRRLGGGRSSAIVRLGHRRASLASRAGQPAERVAAADRRPARGRRSARATGRRTTACAGRGRTADRPPAARSREPATSTPPRSISTQPSRIASWIARQRSRWSAPGCSPGWRRGRPSGRSRAARRGGRGSGRRAVAARRWPPISPPARPAPGLEVDEVAGLERGAPPARRTPAAARTRTGAARRSRGAGRRSGRARQPATRPGSRSPPPPQQYM